MTPSISWRVRPARSQCCEKHSHIIRVREHKHGILDIDMSLENCTMARSIKDGSLSPSVLKSSVPSTGDAGAGGESLLSQNAAAARRKNMGGGKKNRGPINLDRQCGVINNKGLPCSRSLTCKSHSMGAKRNVPGRSQPYDILLFEWQKATNPAFVARLEEKERQIAAMKSASQANKEKKRKAAHEKRADPTEREASGSSSRVAVDHASDMYKAGATFQEVDRDLFSTLHSIHSVAARERTNILPMATRSLAGQYTTRTKRFRVLRQFLAQGLSGTAHVRARINEVAEGSRDPS